VFPAVLKTMGKSFWKKLRRLYKQSIEDMKKKKKKVFIRNDVDRYETKKINAKRR